VVSLGEAIEWLWLCAVSEGGADRNGNKTLTKELFAWHSNLWLW
jgi:hypothetical protein